MSNEETLSTHEAGKCLGLTPRALVALIDDGTLPAVRGDFAGFPGVPDSARPRGALLVRAEDVERLVAERQTGPSAPEEGS